MDASARSRVIDLVGVSKTYAANGVRTVVFRPTTLALPADRRLVVLGDKHEGKSVLLQLLARSEKPDLGRVVSTARLSPVVNADRIFHRELSGFENLRFYARRFSVDERLLIAAMDHLYPLGRFLEASTGELPVRTRRSIEAAMTAALAFDCYLIDDLGLLDPLMVQRHLDVAGARGAGIVFSTGSLRVARQFADCAVVIKDRTLYPFCRIEEAARFYERD